MVDPRDLRNLLAVYEHRHFGKAAKENGLSQPAITKSIQRLEKDFGLVLFDQSRSHVGPTAVCESIVSHAKSALAELSALQRVVRMLRGLETGSLAVGTGPAMSESFVMQAFGSLAQDQPRLQFEVRVDHWKQLSQWLIAGEIDLLIADLADLTKDKATPNDVALPAIQCESYSALKRIVLESECVSVALAGTIRTEVEQGLLNTLAVDAPKLQTNAGIVRLRHRTLSPLAAALIERIATLAAANERGLARATPVGTHSRRDSDLGDS